MKENTNVFEILDPKTAVMPEFKDSRLAKAAEAIQTALVKGNEIHSKATADMLPQQVAIARALGMVKRDKSYESDGFTSVDDFAEKVFGIKRANAYQLAGVGERFYLKDDNATADTLAISRDYPAFTPSKLAELRNLTDEQIQTGLDSGDISPASSQKQLREFAKATKATAKSADDTVKTLPLFDWCAYMGHTVVKSDSPDIEEDIIPSVLAVFALDGATPETVNAKGGKTPNGIAIHRKCLIVPVADRVVPIVVDYTLRKTPKATAPKAEQPKMTREQLLELLAQMDDAEAEANEGGQ